MLWNNIGKNHVGYQGIANVMNIVLILENDIILYKGPQAVANPGQNLILSAGSGAAAVFSPIKLVNYRANSISVFPPLVVLTELSWIPKVLAGIVIVQLTQHVQTQQQVADPRAPSGARVYLLPLENNVLQASLRIVILIDGTIITSLKNFGSEVLHGASSAAKWVAPVLHKVMGAVSGPIGAINPIAGMIARGVCGAAGMANKFLNR
ncbi:MAG: hypothetical protein EZS28_011533 [Streblomastix strix]|uniref:Uncharacterized protein n=1 Tax=Streblomastix strix TaxID=222440 RepID=A0A5J4WE45_9EUKA|nr:MAG: hypothetical protein EZS28_011533 [Streblomastix strix]